VAAARPPHRGTGRTGAGVAAGGRGAARWAVGASSDAAAVSTAHRREAVLGGVGARGPRARRRSPRRPLPAPPRTAARGEAQHERAVGVRHDDGAVADGADAPVLHPVAHLVELRARHRLVRLDQRERLVGAARDPTRRSGGGSSTSGSGSGSGSSGVPAGEKRASGGVRVGEKTLLATITS
jgi:hypothetical protein